MRNIINFFLFLSPLSIQTLAAFNFIKNIPDVSPRRSYSSLCLVPMSSMTDPLKRTFLNSPQSFRACIEVNGKFIAPDMVGPPFQLCIADEDDLPIVSKLMIDAFGADAITLSTDLSSLERSLLNPGVEAFNAYSGLVAYTEVLSGLRRRLLHRLNKDKGNLQEESHDNMLSPPPIINYNDTEAENIAAKSSIILALGREVEDDTKNKNIEIVATVELRLQPTDAKIPFSEPWFDRIERYVARALNMDVKPTELHLQPYLSNLCVDKSVRGRQIGKAMCRCVEKIVKDVWGYEKIYLHVDLENSAALNLYRGEGYKDVGSRWNPFWAGKASEIGYYYKKL